MKITEQQNENPKNIADTEATEQAQAAELQRRLDDLITDMKENIPNLPEATDRALDELKDAVNKESDAVKATSALLHAEVLASSGNDTEEK